MIETSSAIDTVEQCWALIGHQQGRVWLGQRVQPTTGKPVSVEFDGQWVLEREERHGDIIGFCHTHPGGSPEPSTRDLQTMRAWVGSFGKRLLCLIEPGDLVTAFRFDDDGCQGIELSLCELSPGERFVVCE